MDTDSFDTYVSSKGFTYLKNKTENRYVGVTYGLNSNQDGNGRADKYISLFTRPTQKRNKEEKVCEDLIRIETRKNTW